PSGSPDSSVDTRRVVPVLRSRRYRFSARPGATGPPRLAPSDWKARYLPFADSELYTEPGPQNGRHAVPLFVGSVRAGSPAPLRDASSTRLLSRSYTYTFAMPGTPSAGKSPDAGGQGLSLNTCGGSGLASHAPKLTCRPSAEMAGPQIQASPSSVSATEATRVVVRVM